MHWGKFRKVREGMIIILFIIGAIHRTLAATENKILFEFHTTAGLSRFFLLLQCAGAFLFISDRTHA